MAVLKFAVLMQNLALIDLASTLYSLNSSPFFCRSIIKKLFLIMDRYDDEPYVIDGELIELVKVNPVIFNNKHKDYKDKAIVEGVWERIAQTLKLGNCRTAQLRWFNIRQRYNKERRRMKEAGGNYLSKWPYFEKCSFLDTIIVPRNRNLGYIKRRIENKPATFVSAWGLNKEVTAEQVISRQHLLKDNPLLIKENSENNSISQNREVIEEIDLEADEKQKKQQQQAENDNFELAQMVMHFCKQVGENVNRIHPLELTNINYSFGRTVALLLEEMNTERQKKARLAIMKVVQDFAG